MLHTLGVSEIGRYTWAVLVVGYFDILINFGLGVLITRDVAREPQSADRYLGGSLVVRGVLWAVSIGIALGLVGPLAEPLGISAEAGVTLALLTVGIGISNISGLASALFNAAERMEFPAYVTIFTSALKVVCGVAALVMGYGIVGIAIVSIVVNAVTGVVLLAMLVRFLGMPHPQPSTGFGVELMRSSYPLMINNLLATVFFRIDGLILNAVSGEAALGWYGTAYKFLDGLNIIPSNLTLALFPLLSRLSTARGHGATGSNPGRDDFTRTVEMALRALINLALPIAVGTTILAEPIIGLFAGEKFLPHSAIALAILIWFAPFSFVNGLLQYVLIAVNRQRFITLSFVIATVFNVAANVVAVSLWSYVGASAVTVASELLLLVLFSIALRHEVRPTRLLAQSWRSALAAAIMAPAVWVVAEGSPILAVAVGAIVYGCVLLLLRGVTSEELAVVRRALPFHSRSAER